MNSCFFHCFHQIGWNFTFLSGFNCFSFNNIYNTFKSTFFANGKINFNRLNIGIFSNCFQSFIVIGIIIIHSVNYKHLTHFAFFNLFQGKFQTNFIATCRISYDYSIFHSRYSYNCISNEIWTTRCIQNVYLMIKIFNITNGKTQGHIFSDFFRIKIHYSIAFFNSAQAVCRFR